MRRAERRLCPLLVAVNKSGKDEGADFIPCVAWEKSAEVIGDNMSKGNGILVEVGYGSDHMTWIMASDG